MKETNTNKGITLIALVITIIVMLILAAVTINMAVNGGLFAQAGKAVGDTRNAINSEQALANGQIRVGGVLYNSIDDYIAGKPAAIHKWTRTVDTFTCSHCNATYTMGDVVKYTPTGKASTTLTAEKSGTSADQIIEAQNVNWIVLGIEDTDNDKINETLLITTESHVGVNESDGISFYNDAPYNNGVEELNRICKELYSNNEYGQARSINVDDVNSALNYTPLGGEYYDGSNYYTTEGITTKLKDLPIWNTIKEKGTKTPNPNDNDSETDLGEYELNGYEYGVTSDWTKIGNTNYQTTNEITDIERETIFGKYTAARAVAEVFSMRYLLASKCILFDSNGVSFDLFSVHNGHMSSGNKSFSNNPNVSNAGYVRGFRPVVPLMSNLPEVINTISFTITDGTYTLELTAFEGMTWEDFITSDGNMYNIDVSLFLPLATETGYCISESETFTPFSIDTPIKKDFTYYFVEKQ